MTGKEVVWNESSTYLLPFAKLYKHINFSEIDFVFVNVCHVISRAKILIYISTGLAQTPKGS
jgi:hypothetical protein